jgi:hypothetical protein
MLRKWPMTGWYNPPLLMRTGIRVAISTVFGEFADKREMLAVSSPIAPSPFDPELDYSESDEGDGFWLDYVADAGDGWDSTYAVARLLARDGIQTAGSELLPRGKVLVMGGDEVYPVASSQAYQERLFAPYDEAVSAEHGRPAWGWKHGPDLYAIPGNHDWYDGLNAFFASFCRRRVPSPDGFGIARPGKVIGGRRTRQTRSYFALKLPGGWWLWATDSQLKGYIDQPQIDYFQHAASAWMERGSKVILCVGVPSWEYVRKEDPKVTFRNFSFLERLAGMAVDTSGQPKGHTLRLILSGDAHHYAHFTEDDRHYVTCGGGGAFLHPTHHLTSKSFEYDYSKPGVSLPRHGHASYPRRFELGAVYPDARTSWWLTALNWLFPAINPGFTAFMVAACFLFSWLLDFNARIDGAGSLTAALGKGGLCEAIRTYGGLIVFSPWPAILLALAFSGYCYFADATSRPARLGMGVVHGLAQLSAVAITSSLAARWIPHSASPFVALAGIAAAAGLASAFCFGGYLWISLALFKRHWNEAFSSLRRRSHKSFLRIRIANDGTLRVYPIGLAKVPRDSGRQSRNSLLSPHLIEPGFSI